MQNFKTPIFWSTPPPWECRPWKQSILYSFQSIPKHVTFLDICYAPPKTKLLELARENGFQAYNGIGMLLYQGVEAFRIWTGCEFPLEYVEQQNLFANDLNP
ncbi:hypothetical protein [Enterocloster asparagiformis]|uniref:hypothetical protein n=1 Tax=Enterocloster asparagiformis TaxID=333367 RepID=UPI0011CBA533|nr:hypothetical protein [Enterocloster asparagiformis]